jgi:hypothetical protein
VGNSIPGMPAHCLALLCTSGGIFGRAQYIFGFREFNYTYWALIRVPGRVRWDGLKQMGLDDVVPIRKVLPFRDVLIFLGSGLLWGTVFESQQCI